MLRSTFDVNPFVSPTFSAAATAVPIFARKLEIAGRTYGCTLFVNKITNVWLAGSIHTEVPVNPVCPYEPSGNKSPRGAEYAVSMSQPSPRIFGLHGGVCGVIIL